MRTKYRAIRPSSFRVIKVLRTWNIMDLPHPYANAMNIRKSLKTSLAEEERKPA